LSNGPDLPISTELPDSQIALKWSSLLSTGMLADFRSSILEHSVLAAKFSLFASPGICDDSSGFAEFFEAGGGVLRQFPC